MNYLRFLPRFTHADYLKRLATRKVPSDADAFFISGKAWNQPTAHSFSLGITGGDGLTGANGRKFNHLPMPRQRGD